MARPTINQIANLQTQLTTTNDSANNRVLKAGDTMTGNLTFSGTGLRILGDMSNATIGNRLAFQTSITNGNSDLNIIPNGTSVTSGIRLNNNSDTTNAGYVRMSLNSTEASISADRNSVSGTYLPLGFNTGGSERMRIDTSGRICIATTTGRTPLSVAQFTNGTPALGNTSFYSASFMDTFASYGLGVHVSSATGITVLQSQRFDGTATAYDIALNPYGGNVGIGTTSPASFAGYGNLSLNGTSGSIFSLFRNGTRESRVQVAADGLSLITDISAPIMFKPNDTERMRIDSSGNVGIGGTADAYAKTQIRGTLPTNSNISIGYSNIGTIPSGSTGGAYYFHTAASTATASFTCADLYHYFTYQGSFGAGSSVTRQYGYFVDSSLTGATNNYGFYSAIASGSNRWNFYAAGTADNYFAGNALFGKTTTNVDTVGSRIDGAGRIFASISTQETLYVRDTGAAAYRFYVTSGGTIFATNTTISAISDQRYKENVRDLDVGLDAIMALKPRKFDWKEGKGKNIKGDRGFIAQEFEQVFPDLVDTWKDPAPEGEESYKSMRQDLIPVLVKAIQELSAKVAALENK